MRSSTEALRAPSSGRWGPTSVQDSARLKRVLSANTTPERVVRNLIRELGYRATSCVRGLPGRPDLVLSRIRKVVMVHGCFWHRHRCKRGRSTPSMNALLWQEKFSKTRSRDAASRRALRFAGWDVLVVWECQTIPARRAALVERLRQFLTASPANTKS